MTDSYIDSILQIKKAFMNYFISFIDVRLA